MNCEARDWQHDSKRLTKYSFNHRLRDYGRPVGYDCFHGDVSTHHVQISVVRLTPEQIRDILKMPLVHQPGEAWEYGTGIDWAGIVLERATNVRLNDWIQENICAPLGLHAVNMFPTADMKQNLAYMHQKWPGEGNKSEERDHILREPILAETVEERARIFNSGGAGLFAKPSEYVQILTVLLNDGTHPRNGAQILKKETVEMM